MGIGVTLEGPLKNTKNTTLISLHSLLPSPLPSSSFFLAGLHKGDLLHPPTWPARGEEFLAGSRESHQGRRRCHGVLDWEEEAQGGEEESAKGEDRGGGQRGGSGGA